MRKLKRKNNFSYKISKYLPVFIILLSLSIIIGSTFAYFTDKVERTSELTFSKVELSGETTTGINGSLRDVIPGTPLVDGALKFSKSIDSEAIYVRAKISFSLPSEYKNDADMKEMVDLLRSATDFNIVSEAQHGAVWSAKDGNYFYLLSSADNTKLMRVDTVDTYVLSDEVVVPRDLESLPNNAQYMKSINFHVAFEAIQADNVSSVLSETKETFNVLFPENEAEKYIDNGNDDNEDDGDDNGGNGDNGDNGDNKDKVTVVFKGIDGESDLEIMDVNQGEVFNEPIVNIPTDENDVPQYMIAGWYIDSELTSKYEFGQVIEEGLTLYPLVYEVSTGLDFYSVVIDGVEGFSVRVGSCNDINIVVPNTYRGLPIIEVDSSAFYNLSTITSIVLPNSIMEIGNRAFYGCRKLVLTELPSSITYIGDSAFSSCKLLALTELPSGVTYIGERAFSGCSKITLTELPSGVTQINDSAFSSCSKLALTELPSGVTYIGERAFSGCKLLALTSISSSVTFIGESAFTNCTSLPSTASVYYLGIEGTNNTIVIEAKSTSITSVTWPENVIRIMDRAFSSCSSLTSISFPNTLTHIGTYAFSSCTKLDITSFPQSIQFIDAHAFNDCALSISNGSVYYAGIEGTNNNVVIKATSKTITSVTWPENVTIIAGSAFQECENLVINSLPSTVTHIGENAFFRCYKITLSSLPSGLTAIAGHSFQSCTNLAITELPSGITSIGEYAFTDSSVAITELPSGVIEIGQWSFNGCTNLKSLELPSTVKEIGEFAFSSCDNLEYILCETNEVATLTQGKGRSDSYIYSLQESGYASGTSETEVVISDSVTIYTAEIDGYKWVRTSDNRYFKSIA